MLLSVPGSRSGSASPAGGASPAPNQQEHIPASPGPYNTANENAVGPTAVLQLQHGHFMITMSVTTTFPPSAVLPTVYSLLPSSQLQCDHIDIQVDEKSHKLRVQVIGVNPINNPHAVSTLANRMKSLQTGATVVVHKDLSQLSIDADSISAVSSLLMSSQSRALLDQHIQYYRLHSHPSFIPSLLIYVSTSRIEHVINVMRNFMADPVAGGAVRPPRPAGMEVKGDEIPAAANANAVAPSTPEKADKPEKPAGLPQHRSVHSSSRSPHFKPKIAALPPSGPLDSMTSSSPSSSIAAPPLPSPASALAAAAPTATAPAAAADSHDKPSDLPTCVAETQPIRVDNKWWSSKRAELLSLTTRHAMSHDSLYVYSLAQVRKNIQSLKGLTSIDRIFYACKANHNEHILKVLYDEGIGFECVSIQELKFIRRLFPEVSKDRLLFTPNFASKLEYEEAYFYTDYVNLDNIYPLEAWPEIFRNKTVLIRLDPGQGLGYNSKVQTGGAKSKFGISIEQLESHLELIRTLQLRVIGLHVHKGSGIHDAKVWTKTCTFLTHFIHHFPELRILDLGGGLGVNYKDMDEKLDLELFDSELLKFRSSQPSLEKLQLWLEPGRYLVANVGVLLTPVTQLKSKPTRSFIGVATGMNSLIRPALYESYHEIVNLSKIGTVGYSRHDPTNGGEWLNTQDESTHRLVDIVGPICETGDVLGYARSMPKDTVEGDIILIDTVGAYGRVMSSNYNLREPAKEIAMEEE